MHLLKQQLQQLHNTNTERIKNAGDNPVRNPTKKD